MAFDNPKSNFLSYDEIKVGQSAEFSEIICEKKIRAFSSITGDYHPLHTDKKYAIKSGFTDILAHGLLTSSIASRLVGMYLPGKRALLLSQKFDYLLPVYVGDELHVRGEVVKKIDIYQQISIAVNIMNQKSKLVCKGNFMVKLRSE